MEKRWANLFTANFGSPRCVVFVYVCVHTEITSVKIIWKQFSLLLYESFVNKAWFYALFHFGGYFHAFPALLEYKNEA